MLDQFPKEFSLPLFAASLTARNVDTAGPTQRFLVSLPLPKLDQFFKRFRGSLFPETLPACLLAVDLL